VVGHGHHFDAASTPKYSKEIGEMLSECLGWAYEGADRVWRWDATDGVQRWAHGGEPFLNTLVIDDPDDSVPRPQRDPSVWFFHDLCRRRRCVVAPRLATGTG